MTVSKLSAIYSAFNKRGRQGRQGFVLAELLAGAVLLALVCTAAYGTLRQLTESWQKIFTDLRLRDAGRYMLGNLEKDLVYEGRSIAVQKDRLGVAQINAQCIYGGRSYIYTKEGTALYKQTDTLTTTGKNPLFIPGCAISDWQVRRLADEALEISFTLAADGREQYFRQVFFCLNGRVSDE